MSRIHLIALDFETYYDKEYSLSKITTEEYIRDDRFEVIGVAVKVDDEKTQWCSGTQDEVASFLMRFDWAHSMMLAHNCAFDAAILNWRFGIRPKALADTMSMGNALGDGAGSVSLAALAKQYDLGEKGNEVIKALGKRRLDFTPQELQAYAGYCVNDVELCHKLFEVMLQQGFPTPELKLIDMTLRMFTEPVFVLDTDLLEQHLSEVKAKKQQLLDSCGIDQHVLMSNNQLADKLRELGVEPPVKISKTTGKETYAFAKTDEAFKNLPETLPEDSPMRFIVEAVVAARIGTKSTLEETRTERFIGISKRGKLPVPIKYCGAKTKRWSGEGGGINMQNLPRNSPLKSAIRSPAGHVIVGVDLSNIELRIGLWFGGMTYALDRLRAGRDLYREFAAMVFNVDYNAVTPAQRFIGKTSQLSLIYGVGAKKLQEALKLGSGNDIGIDAANHIVKLYRKTYVGVVAAWHNGESVLEAMLKDHYMEYGPGGVIKVHGQKGLLLPSGLYMRFPNLSRVIRDDGHSAWAYKTRKGIEYTHGAKTYQGVIQALARCQIGDGMLRTRKKYAVALTVHDAEYFLAPEADGQTALDFATEQLCVPPVWAPELPLAAEGGFGYTLKEC